MQNGVNGEKRTGSRRPTELLRGGFFLNWPAVAGLWLILAAAAVAARLATGPRFDGLLLAAIVAGVVVVLVRVYLDKTETRTYAAGKRMKELLD